ncbi:hypothetical protein [Azohydromonas aeria]|uniref:hypothetical protein n=1 Tax=Azohydromonas aeria TaxID=2590212 RepID=UPI0012F85FA1|nr:hypothetical protein [Azohydromonas aeria]
MRTAPAVHLTLEADTPWRVGLCLLGAAAAAVPVLGLALRLELAPAWAFGAAAAAALAGGAWPWRRRAPQAAALAWDGAQWQLWLRGQARPCAGRAQLMIDLGPWLLLRLCPTPSGAPRAARGHWLALSRSRHAAHWHALRCALHARPPAAEGAATGAPRQG